MGAAPHFSSLATLPLRTVYMWVSPPHIPPLRWGHIWGPGLWENGPPASSHRFRQVRLKHRKLREQVNSMVDISKVPGSRGSSEGGWGHGWGNLALEQGTLGRAWHTRALNKGLWLGE